MAAMRTTPLSQNCRIRPLLSSLATLALLLAGPAALLALTPNPDPQAAAHRARARELANKYAYSSAISEYQKAYALDKTAHREDATLDLNKIGNCYLNMSESRQALIYFQRELKIEQQIGDTAGEAVTLNNIGNAYDNLSRYTQALDFFRRSLRLRRQVGDRAGQAMTLSNIASVYRELGRYVPALRIYRQSLTVQRQIADLDGQATTLNNIGEVYDNLSEYLNALDYFQQALPIERQVGNRDEEAATLNNIGAVCSNVSRYAQALDFYRQALPIERQVGDKAGEAATLNNIGQISQELGQYALAMDSFRQALPIQRRIGDKSEEATTLSNIGEIYDTLNEYARALDFYRQALSLRRQIGDKAGEAVSLNNIGEVSDSLRRYAAALGFYRQALPIQRQIGDKSEEGTTLNNIGFVYKELGRYARALDFYRQALSLRRQIGDRDGEATTLHNIMAAWEARNAPRLAIFYGKQAVNTYQNIRAGLQTLDTKTQRAYLASVSDTYHALADLLIGQGRLPEAEQVLRLLKNQELTDFVQRDASFVPAAVGVSFDPDEQAALAGYQKYADPVTTLGRQIELLQSKKVLSDAERQQLVTWQNQLSPAQQKFQTFLTTELPKEMAERKPMTGEDNPGQAIRDAQKQQRQLLAMGPGVVALYTVVEPDKYRVIVVTAKSEQAEEFPIPAQELRRLVFAWRDALRDPNADPRPLGQKLSHILIGPIAADLNGARAQTLLWSLDDVLRYVPLAALYDGQHYLVEKYRTAVFTGASLPSVPAQPADWRGSTGALLALGVTQAHTVTDPVSGASLKFPALPGVDTEMKDIARYDGNPDGVLAGKPLEDAQFTQAALRLGLAGGCPVVHIASHFELGGNYQASFLLLGDGTPLTLDALCGQGGQIFQNVDLLTLSACQTGESVRAGDGHEFESLGSLAQEQGASSILASLWPVSDATTPLLMRAFYRTRTDTPDTSKAEALRQAQLALLHGTLAVPPAPSRGTAADTAMTGGADTPPFTPDPKAPYAHPYYWAPFVLIGNWR